MLYNIGTLILLLGIIFGAINNIINYKNDFHD